jgi:hypothetical protein
MTIGGWSWPFTSRPGSSQIDRLIGASTRVMSWSRSHCSARAISAWPTARPRLRTGPSCRCRARALLGRLAQRELVVVRRDAPTTFAAAAGEEQLDLGVLVERVLARGEQLDDLGAQRRHPVGIAGVDCIGEVDECVEVALAGNGRNHYFCLSTRGSLRSGGS